MTTHRFYRFTISILVLQLSVQVFEAHFSNDNFGGILTRAKRDRSSLYECLPQLDVCLAVLDEKIYNYDGLESINAVKRLGAKEFCEAALPASTCLPDVIKNCAESKPDFTDPYVAEALAYNYLCTEKFEEISQHWDCLASPEVLQGYFQCISKYQPTDICSHNGHIGKCLLRIAEGTSACGSDAATEAHQIASQVAILGKNCLSG